MDSYSRRSRSPRDEGPDYRRRSPPPEYRSSGRRRSRSPVAIDRYQPGREYIPPPRDDFRRRSPPPLTKKIDRYVPGQEPPREVPLFNPVSNPMNLESQAGFSYFAEWWRKEQEIKEEKERQRTGARRPIQRPRSDQESREEREKEREKIQVAYDAYKEKHSMQMAKAFVHAHREEEWFKERYDPAVRDPIRSRLAGFRRDNFNRWASDLENGMFEDFTLEGIYKNDSNGAGGTVEKEEGETAAATEVLGVSDLVPSKGGDLRDEAALLPALLIKTIAPHIGRDKLEALAKEHLGVESEGSFRFLSLSDANPTKKFHRIGWIMLNAKNGGDSDAMDIERRDDGRAEDGKVEDGDAKPEAEAEAFKSLLDTAQAKIHDKTIEDNVKGDFICHVGIHVPPSAPRKKALWDLFSAPERVERDLQLAERLVSKLEQDVGNDINAISKIEDYVEGLKARGLLQPQQPSASNGVTKRDEDSEEEGGNKDENMEDGEEAELEEEVDDEELIIKKKKLDLIVEYLRRVFNFCFFCVFETDSVIELGRKCPGGHLRRPRVSLTTSAKAVAKASAYGEEFPLKRQPGQDDQDQQLRFSRTNKTHQQLQRAFNWVKTYEDKLYQLLEPDSVDLTKLGGKPTDEALEDELKKHISQEDEAKFRCKVPECTKLFRGEPFWRKHVEKRHADWLEKLEKELSEINNYVLDPARLIPSRTDASSTGHFNPNQSYIPLSGGPGAMRTGRGRLGNGGARAAGPYDRQSQDSRNNRWRTPADRGRMDGGRGPRGPHPDALPAGGGAREATAGRSLKSYEDLDAMGGSSNGALDY